MLLNVFDLKHVPDPIVGAVKVSGTTFWTERFMVDYRAIRIGTTKRLRYPLSSTPRRGLEDEDSVHPPALTDWWSSSNLGKHSLMIQAELPTLGELSRLLDESGVRRHDDEIRERLPLDRFTQDRQRGEIVDGDVKEAWT
jgi:hypothetical protein